MQRWLSYLEATPVISESGNLDIEKGRILLKSEEWGKALKSVLAGLERGNLEHPAEAYDLLARIYQKLGKTDKADQAFRRRDNLCKASVLCLA